MSIRSHFWLKELNGTVIILMCIKRGLGAEPPRSRGVRWCCVNFQCRGVLLIWITAGRGPTALAVGADGGCLDIFFLACVSFLFSFSLSLGDGLI